jgi:membrane-bound ClpP family serine protease
MSTLVWPLLLLAFALALLVAEVFVPSGGLIGLLGLSCLVVSLWQAFRHSSGLGLALLAADFVLLPIALSLALYLWPKTPLAKRVFLKPPGPEEIEASDPSQRLDHLIGQFGRALTPLRPSGVVDFEGRRLDGLSEAGLIPAGALVKAVRVRSGQVIVRDAPEIDLDLDPSPETESPPV